MNDAEHLAAYLGGDPLAFTTLVERHQGALLRHARSLLGRGEAHEDVVQETFLRLAQSPPRFDDSATNRSLSSWLHTVMRNLCMDAHRSEARRRRREEEIALADTTAGGIDQVEAEDTRAYVESALERLPEDQREVLVLRLLSERSYKEIATITGRKIGTVGWLVSVGLKALSERLEPVLQGHANLSVEGGRS
ncbi:MAG: sigma-70 family RNA polymerase sigma factor [Planctomycetota bacterium]